MVKSLIMETMESINAIVHGTHGDPFAILGQHQLADGRTAIRAFFPEATAVTLLRPNLPAKRMTKIHPDGFYTITLPQPPDGYSFDLTYHDGHNAERQDPYRFPSTLTNYDEHLLSEGSHRRSYEKLGAHPIRLQEIEGTLFTVWAPNAQRVSVVGLFNAWDGRRHPMRHHHSSGLWELFIPGLGVGDLYKYEIKSRANGRLFIKSDPLAFAAELRPKTASVIWKLDRHVWNDDQWMGKRPYHNALNAPINIYELHLGSWKRKKRGDEWLTYLDLIHELIPYVKQMGYTHIELMPIAEYPFDGSWGYQVTGYFAPTSRYGTPDECMAFVDACHQADIGVILDWVPAHFPKDEHGLARFDGTHLYEHADPRRGTQPDWGTLVFDYGRPQVSQFLISNALFWLDKYHIDGLRVDAVASMIYLDFSRKEGEWLPNQFGGRENLDALAFLRRLNSSIHEQFPGTLTIAEESTTFPDITKTAANGGLGFDLKWNMGWMHDSLNYIQNEPVHRSFHQNTLTFSLSYAFSEAFVLPFSHDEVVHLKKSMLSKMPGDRWQQFANLRLLYGYQWGHPGKKLSFMGGEFGQWREWTEERALDWYLFDEDEKHGQLHAFIRDLNWIYREKRPLYEEDNAWDGFQWLDFRDPDRSILTFARHAPSTGESVLIVCNFTPIVRHHYRMGVPHAGNYTEILNSDDKKYGGSGITNPYPLHSTPIPTHGQEHSIELTLPPLAVLYLA